MFRINAHAHLLPEPTEIPKFMKKNKIFWISKDRKFMKQKGWERPVDHESFFLEPRLDWMHKHYINHEVIITLSQLYCNGLSRKLAYDVIRFHNDFNASIQERYPDKFTAGFTVNPVHIESALKEIERCVRKLGLQVLCLPTHWQDKKGNWLSIGHEKADPIFQLADAFGLAVEIHPYDAPKMISLENRFWRFHLVWMCAQTADAHHMMTTRGLTNEFSNARYCFAHGSQFTQASYGRRLQGFKGRPDLFKDAYAPDSNLFANNVFFDTLVHDVLTMRLLVDRCGSGQIIAGLDNPYPLGEMNSVKNSYPGKVIYEAQMNGIISDTEKKEIWKDNVERWLGFKIRE
ncbi:MAG: amidohydrolase [Bacteroidia bacterium]|nr:amidohydrolase [Bacteroidia bacterium]